MTLDEFLEIIDPLKNKRVYAMVWDNKKQYLDIYSSDVRPLYAKDLAHFSDDEKVVEFEWNHNNKLFKETDLQEAYNILKDGGFLC